MLCPNNNNEPEPLNKIHGGPNHEIQNVDHCCGINWSDINCFPGLRKKPTTPQYENPFDPLNVQTQGDPFKLTAKIANGGIFLQWQKPNKSDLKNFRLYRSENEKAAINCLPPYPLQQRPTLTITLKTATATGMW